MKKMISAPPAERPGSYEEKDRKVVWWPVSGADLVLNLLTAALLIVAVIQLLFGK